MDIIYIKSRQIWKAIFISLLAILLLTGFSPGEGRCEGKMGIVEEIRDIEQDNINRDIQSEDYFGYIKGTIPVLISAPHGAKHFRARENRWKCEDAFTSAIAIKLGRLTGAHVIYVKNKTLEDPNNALNCRYKDFMGKVVKASGIKFVMDIHGAGSSRMFKVDVGILDGRAGKSSCPTFKPIIERDLEGFEQGVFNKHFRARDPGTVTWFAWKKLGVESAQFEINALYRTAEAGQIVERLRAVIEDINKNISGQNISEQVRAVQTMGSGGPTSRVCAERSILKPQSTRPKI